MSRRRLESAIVASDAIRTCNMTQEAEVCANVVGVRWLSSMSLATFILQQASSRIPKGADGRFTSRVLR